MQVARKIRVRGLVQGVGFRPTVWLIANRLGLKGEVLNDGGGVLIHAWGTETAQSQFLTELTEEKPQLARIDAIETEELAGSCPHPDFIITKSEQTRVATSIIPDAATCPQCLEETLEPGNRRYLYPFTNCTHCGPRLSIVSALPYDRAKTSMAPFKMCPDCQAEYDDPADRRFHAQPNACPTCGPQVMLLDAHGLPVAATSKQDDVTFAAQLIRKGCIVAIKGIGGFHFVCDATNSSAVARLRQRKKRWGKPLALMARDVTCIRKYADLPPFLERCLKKPSSPIVLLRRKEQAPPLAFDLAPGQNTLGFFLPYTPLHHVLLQEFETPVVMTSANLSNEPQVVENEEAVSRLFGIAEYFLIHDRKIVNRLDDSVLQEVAGKPVLLRRARGFVPEPLALPEGFEATPPVLAMGGELKNTFCLIKDGAAIVSQHIGDLETPRVHADFRKALDLYCQMQQFSPSYIAVDRHENYFSSRWGEQLAADLGAELLKVQHHHAHIAACMAEHGIPLRGAPVLGVALDGLGAGDNGELWGGEFLLATYTDYERLAQFQSTALVGGEKASREPWRNTFAHLHHCLGWEKVQNEFGDLAFVQRLEQKPLKQLSQMIERGLNAPLISSAGRLFDAVAFALDLCPEDQSFEGEAAMALQALAETAPSDSSAYTIKNSGAVLQWKDLWEGMLKDMSVGVAKSTLAKRFHNTLALAIASKCEELSRTHRFSHVVLTGGVFQNKLLAELTFKLLVDRSILTLMPAQFPAGDGGISLGQGVIAAAQLLCDDNAMHQAK